MEIGDTFTVTYGKHSAELLVAAIDSNNFNIGGNTYTVYALATMHILYEKKGFTVGNSLNIANHIISSDKEIKGGNYYIKINSKSALPL